MAAIEAPASDASGDCAPSSSMSPGSPAPSGDANVSNGPRLTRNMPSGSFGLILGVGYAATYFWNQPIFMFPHEYLKSPSGVGRMSTKELFAVTQALFYFAGKWPALMFVATEDFWLNRIKTLRVLMVAAAASCGIGSGLFYNHPILQAIVFGVGALAGSMMYAIFISFVEGRRCCEVLCALLSFFTMLGLGLARYVSMLLLQWRMSPSAMPVAASAIGLVIALSMVELMKGLPLPSSADVLHRGPRGLLSFVQQENIIRQRPWVLSTAILSYALAMALNACNIYLVLVASPTFLTGSSVVAFVFLLLLGPSLASIGLAFTQVIKRHSRAMAVMAEMMTLGYMVMGGAALLFTFQDMQKIIWLVVSITGTFVIMLYGGPSFFDRTMSRFPECGSVAFLQLIADGLGWAGILFVTLCALPYDDRGEGWDNHMSSIVHLVAAAVMILILLLLTIHLV